MIYYALVFLVVALIAGVLGFSGIAGTAANIAWILFVVGLVLAVVFFVRGREAAFPFYPVEAPVDAAIVGIVDHWSAEGASAPASQA